MSKADQFARIIVAAAALTLFAVLAGPANGAELKFRAASGQEPVIGRYVVTLADSVAEDLVESSVRGMAMTYSGRLEPRPSANVRQFAITMEPARARTLSADPRVREVVEVPQPDQAGSAASSTAPSRADLSRHGLVPVAQDSSSSGTYLYDGSGNIKFIGSDSYVYDNLGRLTVATVQGSQQRYTYDAFGNRILTTRATGAVGCVGGCEAPSTVYPQNNHLTGATYDDAGNVKTVSGSTAATYSYDGTGMATRATVGSDDRMFVYTADDERIAVRNGVSWTWTVRDLSGKVLRELTSLETQSSPLVLGSHTWTKDHVWRDGQLMASVFQAPSGITTYHYHLDHLGTPRLVTDSNGFLVGKHVYYPFGAEMDLTPHENTVELMKFTGHERDIVAADNATVDYMHARYYNGNLGRFLSVDSHHGKADAPQSWNRFSYTYNNPLKHIDENGHDVIVATEMRAAVAYGITHSALFRQQYDRLNHDHNVLWVIHGEFSAKVGTRAHSDTLAPTTDHDGHIHRGEISYIPFLGVRNDATLIAHEGNHLVQELDTGHTILQRAQAHDPDIFLNAGCGPKCYESYAVLEFERKVRVELEHNTDEYLPEVREVVRNMIDLTPAQR